MQPEASPRPPREQVLVDAITIGDYIDPRDGPPAEAAPRCLLGKWPTRRGPARTCQGWLLELAGGEWVWLRRGTLVRRRPRGAASTHEYTAVRVARDPALGAPGARR
jgi:hypothetical protein